MRLFSSESFVSDKNKHTLTSDIRGIALFVAAIWVVFAIDRLLPLEQFGLVPRETSGLIGIVSMPFLHANLTHLLSNTVPLCVTLFLLAGSRTNSTYIVVLITLLGGTGLWLFGRTALHIGASGLVFGLVAFHLFSAVFERRLKTLIIALIVGTLYSTTLLKGIVPFQSGVSWDGHLSGAVAGIVVALIAARLNTPKASSTRTSIFDRR